MHKDESSHLSAYTLDTLELGGLSPEEERHARAHLEHCATCSRRLSDAHTSAEHFQKVVHPRTLEQLRQRMEQSAPEARPERKKVLVLVGLLGALLLAASWWWLVGG